MKLNIRKNILAIKIETGKTKAEACNKFAEIMEGARFGNLKNSKFQMSNCFVMCY